MRRHMASQRPVPRGSGSGRPRRPCTARERLRGGRPAGQAITPPCHARSWASPSHRIGVSRRHPGQLRRGVGVGRRERRLLAHAHDLAHKNGVAHQLRRCIVFPAHQARFLALPSPSSRNTGPPQAGTGPGPKGPDRQRSSGGAGAGSRQRRPRSAHPGAGAGSRERRQRSAHPGAAHVNVVMPMPTT